MNITVEPSRFTGLPLVTKSIGEGDFSVLIDGMRAGRIRLTPIANGETRWFWTITGPALVQAGLSSSGDADSLEVARLRFRERFDEWLEWALSADMAVYWHE